MLAKPLPKLDVRSLLERGFNEETARSLYVQGEEVVIFALMQLAALALKTNDINGQHPSAPSASVPTFQKESKKKRNKKSGANPGHKGCRRPPPVITQRLEHRATKCPDCGTKLNKRNQVRKRLTEDIPQNITPEVVEHTIHRDYCPNCRKIVEPIVPDAMPNATIGNRTVVLTAFLHYYVGTTISQIVEIFNTQFYFKLTPGGLVHLWHNLALLLMLWYEQIGESARQSTVLHADETGWRVNGKTYWLWCFSNNDVTYYVIDRSRASPVVRRFFKRAFDGIFVTDFWGAYNAIVCAGKQKCLSHLLGDLKKVAKYKDKSGDWTTFSKRLKRIVRDAMRLRGRRESLPVSEYEGLRNRIEKRLTRHLKTAWQNTEAKRLVKRLKRHRQELLTFLYHDGVPFDNNHAERTIRNGVVMRKNSYCNRSVDGATTQAILMSIFATLKQRGFHGTSIIVEAVREYLLTKKLPDLPTKTLHTAE
jgi:transposase